MEHILLQETIVVANFLKSETQEDIDAWRLKSGCLSAESFNLDYDNRVLAFKQVIFAVVDYFNTLFKRMDKVECRSQIDKELKTYEGYCRWIMQIIDGLDLMSSANSSERENHMEFSQKTGKKHSFLASSSSS